jgi:hypothetical protein
MVCLWCFVGGFLVGFVVSIFVLGFEGRPPGDYLDVAILFFPSNLARLIFRIKEGKREIVCGGLILLPALASFILLMPTRPNMPFIPLYGAMALVGFSVPVFYIWMVHYLLDLKRRDWKDCKPKRIKTHVVKMKFMLLLLFVTSLSFGQDWQNRDAVHVQADVGGNWFVAGWSITNLRTISLNNTNFFGGVGYRGESWWAETMVQRQWNTKADQWAMDFRFDKQAGRWHLYVEGSPFLTKKAFYEFLVAERRTWKGFSLGAETENTHQPGPDTIAIGPRAGHKLGRIGKFDVTAIAAVRLSPNGGHTEPRLYFVLNRHIKRR